MIVKTLKSHPGRLNKTGRLLQKTFRTALSFPYIPSARSYNITICHEKKFLWFRVAKVGTRTILGSLQESGVSLDIESASFIHYPVGKLKDYYKFAFVRNPWGRLVSCWQDKVVRNNIFGFKKTELQRMQDFANFIEFVGNLDMERCDRHIRLQSALINLDDINYLGRMETFDDDFAEVRRVLSLPQKKIQRKNATSYIKHYKEYYNPVLAEKVAGIYRKDIQIFGYKF